MSQRVLIILAFLFMATTWALAKSSEAKLLYCDKPQFSGLFRQCQDVRVVQNLGDRSRVYLLVERRVVLVPHSNLFNGRTAESIHTLKPLARVAVPGSHLWNQTSEGYESLCSVKAVQARTRLVNVDCGINKSGWIKFEDILVLDDFQS